MHVTQFCSTIFQDVEISSRGAIYQVSPEGKNMNLFTIDKNGKLIPYKEHDFKDSNRETDLEVLLENNPEYFFEESKILIIGRQVTTNLNSIIDLLGIDKPVIL